MLKIKQGQKLGNFLNNNEDNLTFNVFTRLLYLKEDFFIEILKNAFGIKYKLKSLNSVTFWPSWNALNTNNNKRVIPDLFIRCEHYDIIIEAKRYDLGQQYDGQWENQINAYQNEYKKDNKKLIYIPLGGMSYSKFNNAHADMHQSYWFQLANACELSLGELSDNDNSTSKILVDVLRILAFYGHTSLKTLGSLPQTKITTTPNYFIND